MAGDADRERLRDFALKAFPVGVALGAGAVYGLLILAYSTFYKELGVRPSDVGLDYGRGLGGAAGLALFAVAVFVIPAGTFLLVRQLRTRRRSPTESEPRGLRPDHVVAAIGGAVWLAVILALVSVFLWKANDWADAVKKGNPVNPANVLGIELLAVRADPARVEPIGARAQASRMVSGLEGRELMYLGRTTSTIVLYDPDREHAIHVPAAMVMVETSNCETKFNTDPKCVRAVN
jgi:hypothetical protein